MGPDDEDKEEVPADQASPAQPNVGRGRGNRPFNGPSDELARKVRADRIERVGELLLQNKSKRAIARELGVDESTIRADVERWVEINPSPGAAQVRAHEEAELVRLRGYLERALVQVGVAVEVAGGAMKRGIDAATGLPTASLADQLQALRGAVDSLTQLSGRAIRLSESRRRLHGADAPQQVHVTAEVQSQVVHHVMTVPFEETLQVIEANTSAPALPAATDDARIIQ